MTTYEDLKPGTIVRTRTGKLDAIILPNGMSTADRIANNERIKAWRDANPTAISGPLPSKSVEPFVVYRSLKNGRAWGPVRTANPKDLTIV